MASLDDVFGVQKPVAQNSQILEGVYVACPICHREVDEKIYSRSDKKIKIVCSNGHTEEFEMDLSWLIP